jgi:hypothetical protein
MDILINETQFEQLQKFLASDGFSTKDESPDIALRAKSHKVTFIKKQVMTVCIDVHTDIRYMGQSINEGDLTYNERLWNNACVVQAGENNIVTLSAEDSILNLIAHQIFENRVVPVSLYCDIGYLLKKHGETIDWNYITRFANSIPAGDLILTTLRSILKSCGFEKETEIIAEKASEGLTAASNSVLTLIRKNTSLVHANMLEDLITQKSLRKKAEYLFSYLFPSKIYIQQAYGIHGNKHGLIIYHYIRRIVAIPIGAGLLAYRIVLLKVKQGTEKAN